MKDCTEIEKNLPDFFKKKLAEIDKTGKKPFGGREGELLLMKDAVAVVNYTQDPKMIKKIASLDPNAIQVILPEIDIGEHSGGSLSMVFDYAQDYATHLQQQKGSLFARLFKNTR